MVNVWGLVDDAVGREQLTLRDMRDRSESAEGLKPPSLVFEGPVKQVVIQQSQRGENIVQPSPSGDEIMAKRSKDEKKARSAWANGSFFLFVFVIVLVTLDVLARSVSPYILPIILIAGVIFVPLIGALQLRMDTQLSEKLFLELMELVIGQLPLLGRLTQQKQ